MTPDAVHRYEISLAPTAYVFTPGQRIQLQISSADLEQPEKLLDMVAQGHLLRRSPSWVSILHDAEHPSELSLPITDGNRIGTYMSAGTSAIS